jgi:hypothetical protein
MGYAGFFRLVTALGCYLGSGAVEHPHLAVLGHKPHFVPFIILARPLHTAKVVVCHKYQPCPIVHIVAFLRPCGRLFSLCGIVASLGREKRTMTAFCASAGVFI